MANEQERRIYDRCLTRVGELEAENAKLRERIDAAHMSRLLTENENEELRELVRCYFNAPCLECNPWAEGWEGCKYCESGNCTLAVRTLELGIEVEW